MFKQIGDFSAGFWISTTSKTINEHAGATKSSLLIGQKIFPALEVATGNKIWS